MSEEPIRKTELTQAAADRAERGNEEYAKFLPQDSPARAVSRLGPELSNVLVSIKMITVLGAGGESL